MKDFARLRGVFLFWGLALVAAGFALLSNEPVYCMVPSEDSSSDSFLQSIKDFLGETKSDSKKESQTEVGPSTVGWAEPSAPQVQLGEQSNARVGIQDGRSSEAHPVARDPAEDAGPSSKRRRVDSVNAPETSTSSGWSGSWIDKWLNPGDTSSAPGDGSGPQYLNVPSETERRAAPEQPTPIQPQDAPNEPQAPARHDPSPWEDPLWNMEHQRIKDRIATLTPFMQL